MSAPPSATAILPEALLPWVWQGAGGLPAGRGRAQPVVGSGFPALDEQLPGGGWPRGALCELLVDEPLACEWRLLLPALRQVARRGEPVFLVGPPQPPQAALHAALGCAAARLVWVQARQPAQAAWACEQILKSGIDAAVLAWLPRIGAAPLRRLQAAAQARMAAALQAGGPDAAGCLLVAVRPAAVRAQSSPAPLRVAVAPAGEAGASGGLCVRILKRRGPLLETPVELAALADGLAPVLAGKLARPGGLSARRRARLQTAAPLVLPAVPQGLPAAPVPSGLPVAATAAPAAVAAATAPAAPTAAAPVAAVTAAAPAPAVIAAAPAAPPATVFVLPELNHAVLAGPAPTLA